MARAQKLGWIALVALYGLRDEIADKAETSSLSPTRARFGSISFKNGKSEAQGRFSISFRF